MRKSVVYNVCLFLLMAPAFTACDSPHYVENNGVRYYDANGLSTDSLPSGPYTKSGQYLNNPNEATNTRDNRGSRPQGYGHDTDDDYQSPPPGTRMIYPAGTEVWGDGTVVYPNGTVVYPGSQTTTTTRTTVIETTR